MKNGGPIVYERNILLTRRKAPAGTAVKNGGPIVYERNILLTRRKAPAGTAGTTVDIYAPNIGGVRYSLNGDFIGFLEL